MALVISQCRCLTITLRAVVQQQLESSQFNTTLGAQSKNVIRQSLYLVDLQTRFPPKRKEVDVINLGHR